MLRHLRFIFHLILPAVADEEAGGAESSVLAYGGRWQSWDPGALRRIGSRAACILL